MHFFMNVFFVFSTNLQRFQRNDVIIYDVTVIISLECIFCWILSIATRVPSFVALDVQTSE